MANFTQLYDYSKTVTNLPRNPFKCSRSNAALCLIQLKSLLDNRILILVSLRKELAAAFLASDLY